MFPAILQWVERIRRDHPWAPGSVLEVGSFNVNGSPRSLFKDATSYIGVDLRAGPDVDEIVDGHDLVSWAAGRWFDTVLCFECLEHDPKFWLTVRSMREVLCDGGHLLVSVPTFGFPVHRYPLDCYRLGEDAFRSYVFTGMQIVHIGTASANKTSRSICGCAIK